MQRALLTYLILREKADHSETDFEQFKQRMIAAHPEYMQEIIEDFDRARAGEFAPAMSDEEMDEMPRLDASSLDHALEQMKALGIGLEG